METLKILIKPLSKLKNGNIKLKITDKDKKPLRDIVVSDFIELYLKVRLYGMEYASGLIRIEQN